MIIARGQSFSNSLATRGEKTVPGISLLFFKNENMPRWNRIWNEDFFKNQSRKNRSLSKLMRVHKWLNYFTLKGNVPEN